MTRILLFIGKVVYWCAWPAFWVYFKRSYGRTRIVLVQDDKILAVKGWISDGKWILPGGGLHKNEPIVQGALRELQEETGVQLKAQQLRHLGKGQYHKYGFSFDYEVFAARVGEVQTHRQRHEIAELRWIDPRQVTAKNTGQDSLQAIRLATASGFLLQ